MTNSWIEVCGYGFEFVCEIVPESDAGGNLIEYVHELPTGIRGNRHAAGPFCTFRVTGPSGSGIYLLVLDSRIVYVGQARDFAKRWGPIGYGHIHARNYHYDGQSTNCKVNATVLAYAKAGTPLSLWFHPNPRPRYGRGAAVASPYPRTERSAGHAQTTSCTSNPTTRQEFKSDANYRRLPASTPR